MPASAYRPSKPEASWQRLVVQILEAFNGDRSLRQLETVLDAAALRCEWPR